MRWRTDGAGWRFVWRKAVDVRVVHFDRGRFKVESESKPGTWYFVDLLANNQLGRCDCANFRTRIGPIHHKLEEGQMTMMDVPADFEWRCKHIEAARDFWADMWLKICEDMEQEKFTKHEV